MKTIYVIALFVVAVFATSFISIGIDGLAFAQDSPVETPDPQETPQPDPSPTLEAPQFPDELPETAEGLLPFVKEWLLFVAALVATHIMNGVKNIPWFGKQKWFVKLVTELVSGMTASVVAFLLGTVAIALGFLDASGLWQVILFAWPAAVGIYHGKKLSKGIAKA